MERRRSVLKPPRSTAAAEGVAMLKRGAAAIKFSRASDKSHPTTFRLSEDERVLSWEGSTLSKVLTREKREVALADVIELEVGADPPPDPLALQRTAAFGPRAHHVDSASPSFRTSAGRHSSGGEPHRMLTLVLIGSLPAPPSLNDGAAAPAAPPRDSLRLQCLDDKSAALWRAALRALLEERQPPSPLGPAAIAGSFGAPLDEVALVDTPSGLLVPGVLEALLLALQADAEGLRAEGIFRVSALESELVEARRRVQEADESEKALAQASAHCLASLIKAYLRELPLEIWWPAREQVIALLADGGGGVELGHKLRELLPSLSRRASAVVVWVCDLMAEVIAQEAHNRMGLSAMTAVLAPVLMRGAVDEGEETLDPRVQMTAAEDKIKLAGALFQSHLERPLTVADTRGRSSSVASA
ncbi:hypothetical protein AB1Y20_005871 [Prymnesium parvum]|uniref:Rho-GAP domain-containing protein n=1 Tax=Prymnesium parvum TaxID=97485 RepID=A0AB34J280_PRYPA